MLAGQYENKTETAIQAPVANALPHGPAPARHGAAGAKAVQHRQRQGDEQDHDRPSCEPHEQIRPARSGIKLNATGIATTTPIESRTNTIVGTVKVKVSK